MAEKDHTALQGMLDTQIFADEIFGFHAQQAAEKALKAWLSLIEQRLRRIQQFPLLWPVYEGEYWRYLLQRFPYGLVYRIDPKKVFILAVAHLHRHPGYWKNPV